MRRAWALLLVAGCGRIGFQSAGDASEQDGSDGPAFAWEPIGDSDTAGGASDVLPTTTDVGAPRLVLLPDGRPLISWSDTASGNVDIKLRIWSGTAWTGLGGSDVGGGISDDPESSIIGALAADSPTRICQSWVADEADRLRMRCWDGVAWIGLAGSETEIPTPGNPWWPSVTFAGGLPVVAFEDYGGGTAGVYARHYDGTQWQWLGPSALPGIDGPGRLVEIHGASLTDLWLVFQRTDLSEVRIARWNGTTWSTTAPGSGAVVTGTGVGNANLALGPDAYLTWETSSITPELHVARWDGTTWIELPPVWQGPIVSIQAALQVMPDGKAVVAFNADNDVHVRLWDGTSWSPIGGQDAGGVSKSGAAAWPALAIGDDGSIVVAWREGLGSHRQIYLRQLAP